LLPSAILELARKLLLDPSIQKVCFGFDADLARIRMLFPELANALTGKSGSARYNIVDLQLREAPSRPQCPQYKSEQAEASKEGIKTSPQRISLGKLVWLVLGQRLDKTCQQSNWDRRPLRADQIAYSALDAQVLLRLREEQPPAVGLGGRAGDSPPRRCYGGDRSSGSHGSPNPPAGHQPPTRVLGAAGGLC
jgi:hypothetical protein